MTTSVRYALIAANFFFVVMNFYFAVCEYRYSPTGSAWNIIGACLNASAVLFLLFHK